MRSALASLLLGGAGIACALAVACSSDTGAPSPRSSGGAGQGGSAGAPASGGGGGIMPIAGNAAAGASSGAAGSMAGLAGGGASAGEGGAAGQMASGGAGGEGGAPGPFELTSPEFVEGAPIDVKFRCTGDNVTPVLSWTRGPLGTLSYAVTMIHVGSKSVHWVLFDVAPGTRMLPEGIAREAMPATLPGTKQIKPNIDGADWYGYTGPCPGSANQSYEYSVYALDVAMLPGITADSASMAASDAVKAHQLAVAHLTGMASK